MLGTSNYCYDENELKEYLASINTGLELSGDEFFHGTVLDSYMKILMDGAISSAYVRKVNSHGGNNGKFFVSVAKVNSSAFWQYSTRFGFLLRSDILTFDTAYGKVVGENAEFLSESDYYVRPSGIDGECQVYGSIPLNKTKAIMVPEANFGIGQAIYLAEECGYEFPVVSTDGMKLVDNEEIKRLIRVK